MRAKKWSLVSYATGEEYERIRALQKELSAVTGSTTSLAGWEPHITLGDAIEAGEEQVLQLERELADFARARGPITTNITGFGGTDSWNGAVEGLTPYVLWLSIELTPELLDIWKDLRESITSKYSTWYSTAVYIPHVTLAFADLSKDGYERGSAYLQRKPFPPTMVISHIALTECYGKGNTASKEFRRFPFPA